MNARQNLFAYLLLLPCLIPLTIFVLIPGIESFVLSFQEDNVMLGGGDWIGLGHYQELISSPEYWNSLRMSLRFVLFTAPFAVIVSLMIAFFLDQNPYVRGFFRTIFLLPVGISPAMAGMLWVFLYNPTAGYLNYGLSLLGFEGPAWFGDSMWSMVAVSIASIWKEVGFNVIFFLAGLAGVPQDVYEAAMIDGASFWKRFFKITLPLISPTILFVTTVTMIHSFESFGQIHIMTRGGPAEATNVLVYNLYKDAFQSFRTGFASAQAVMLFLIIMMFTAAQFWISRKRVHY